MPLVDRKSRSKLCARGKPGVRQWTHGSMLDDRQGSRVGGGEAAGGGSPRIALPFAGDVIQPPQVATRKASDGQEEWEGGTNRVRARLQNLPNFGELIERVMDGLV